jgi:hypothetical protein
VVGIAWLSLVPAVRLEAEDWPQFRGPNASGVSSSSSRLPREFSHDRNVAWSAELGEGIASPVVAAGRVFEYPIDADTAGRAAFRGASEFTNPDLAGKDSYEERTAAGIALARGIIDSAHDLGISAAIAISPLEFPKEFAAALPEAKVLHGLESMTIGPGPRQPPDDPLLSKLVATQIRAYLQTYPKLDALYLTLASFPIGSSIARRRGSGSTPGPAWASSLASSS